MWIITGASSTLCIILFIVIFVCVFTTGDAFSMSMTKTPFSTFKFAPNGVCVSPRYFVESEYPSSKDEQQQQQQQVQQQSPLNQRFFTMRNVPGEGDCMFLAVALATLASMGLGANDALLRAISREKRDLVATIFEKGSGTLVIEGKRLVTASALLKSAAAGENVTPQEYLRLLRLEGIDGGLYGGGPELTVLSNVLRRPISIYHLANDNNPLSARNVEKNSSNIKEVRGGNQSTSVESETESNTTTTTTNGDKNLQKNDEIIQIQCMGVFGADAFPDPLERIPESAVLSSDLQQLGAYSWHLHILVVDASPTEKHACVLLPQELDRQPRDAL